MRQEYRLIDRSLIRHFGNVVVTLDKTIGDRFVSEGKARSGSRSSVSDKSLRQPPSNKMVFIAPEEKSFEELGDDKSIKYPGPNDRLFHQIAK